MYAHKHTHIYSFPIRIADSELYTSSPPVVFKPQKPFKKITNNKMNG